MNADKSDGLIHSEITERVIRAFFDVYNELGFGFLESVYEAALCDALSAGGVRFARQVPLPIHFRGRVIADFKLDLVVEQAIVVEIKAVTALNAAHDSQLLNYLKATHLQVGLLLNFGPKAEFRRRVFDSSRFDPRSSASSVAK